MEDMEDLGLSRSVSHAEKRKRANNETVYNYFLQLLEEYKENFTEQSAERVRSALSQELGIKPITTTHTEGPPELISESQRMPSALGQQDNFTAMEFAAPVLDLAPVVEPPLPYFELLLSQRRLVRGRRTPLKIKPTSVAWHLPKTTKDLTKRCERDPTKYTVLRAVAGYRKGENGKWEKVSQTLNSNELSSQYSIHSVRIAHQRRNVGFTWWAKNPIPRLNLVMIRLT